VLRLEIETQCQLRNAVSTTVLKSRQRFAERRPQILEVTVWVLEIRVIEQVEEIRLEGHRRTLIDFEFLANVKIYVGEMRALKAIPSDWSIAPVAAVH
jgi:hypothetical protein